MVSFTIKVGGIILKRSFFLLLMCVLLIPAALLAMQDTQVPLRLELTGANTSDFPTVIITANVYDRLGQPVFGLTQDNFQVFGELTDQATIVSVENITDNNLPFSTVLAIDTSSSMAGLPLEKAKEAAITFVEQIADNAPVAIVAFDTTERLVQDFTTDKAVLTNAINGLAYGGKTALYDGALLAVQTAADSGSPRRAVILLSDGAEYGGVSSAPREAALNAALSQGVPVYTIGLGYGFDRTFLQELSGGTLAEFYESPSPDQLVEIYDGLAAKLRSQYVITLNVDLPSDGQEYELGLEVTTDESSATATAPLRAPIPVPIVTLPDLPTEPITEPIDITANISADDAITSVDYLIDGISTGALNSEPFTITVDPQTLAPGSHDITVNVTDETGDIGTVSGSFEVAALPPTITITGLPEGEITEPQTITVEVAGQTPPTSLSYSFDGGEATTLTEAPFTFDIDPNTFAPGDHTLTVEVTNEGGATATAESAFSVAALPPTITITGLEEGQEIGETLDVAVTAGGQTPVTGISVTLNGDEIAAADEGQVDFSINPFDLQPGTAQLGITATTESGQSASQSVNVVIPALPPQITISGLEPGETLVEDRPVIIDVASQGDITGVTVQVDGEEVETLTEAPFTYDIDVLALPPGPHILSIEAADANGQTATADTAFVISEGPSLTATALVPTNTPTATATFTPSPTFTSTPDHTATAVEAAALAEQGATQTAESQLVQMMTAQAMSAADAQATLDAQMTATDAAAGATGTLASANSVATQDARATANAQSTLTAQAAEAQLSAEQQATSDALATTDAQATLAAQSALDSQATADARSTATAEAQATATASADEEPTEEVTEAAPTDEPTEVAQVVASPTSDDDTSVTPVATATTTTLTTETQTAGAQDNLLPILCIVAAVVLLLVILFLVIGRQRRSNQT